MFYYNSEVLPQVRLIGKVRYAEPWIHFARCIDEYLIYIIRDGDMYIKENGTKYHLKKNDFLVLEPNMAHEGYEKATCNYYYIHFKSTGISAITKEDENVYLSEMLKKRMDSIHSYNLDEGNVIDPFVCLPKLFTLPDGMDYRGLLRNAMDVYNKREEQYKRIASVDVHRLLLNIAHEFLLYQAKTDNCVNVKKSEVIAEQIRCWLNSHYAQKLSSKSLEDMFEINFDYINRIFSQITGQTIFNYLNTLRILQAKELIRTTNLTFTDIAYLVGIDDKYYFSKLFKKMTGWTPTQYFKNEICSRNEGY